MERLWKADREEYLEIEELLKGNSKLCGYMEENHERERGLSENGWLTSSGVLELACTTQKIHLFRFS